MVSMLKRLGLNRHVTDADLTAVWADARVGESTPNAAAAHVRECPACRARLTALSSWLDGLRIDARDEADAAFPRERLAAQHAQIMRRLEAMERPARVLAFPRFTKPVAVRDAGRQRWIAAAAVAGLIVGIGLGQKIDLRHITTPGLAGGPQPVQNASARVKPVNLLSSDEVFLYDQEPSQVAERVPESLRSMHEITPVARDYDPR